MKDDQGWEEHVVEAPTMVRSPAGYDLFFSGGFFGWNPGEGGLRPYAWAMRAARTARPLQRRARQSDAPQLPRQTGGLPQRPRPPEHLHYVGPHLPELPRVGGDAVLPKGEDARYLYIAPLFWRDGKPVIGVGLRPRS